MQKKRNVRDAGTANVFFRAKVVPRLMTRQAWKQS